MNQGATFNDEQVAIIRNAIKAKGDEVRARFPVLANNNLIGMLIFLTSIAGVLLCAWSYWQAIIPPWLCIVLVAVLTSFLHELEHDLIHWMYFKNNKTIHNLMLLVVWIFRPGTLSPWARRDMHFRHHKFSGTKKDIEEQGIGNGAPFGWLRCLIMLDTFVGNIVRILLKFPSHKKASAIKTLTKNYFPFGIATAAIWYGFLIFHGSNAVINLLGQTIHWPDAISATINIWEFLVAILIAPFYLRSFCLNFISSNMHYYGDVDSVMKQTQVLTSPLFWPFQLFCFNFGGTHGIHHFVVGETFYIRQLTASTAHKVMKKNGVRFNDLGTFKRENRFEIDTGLPQTP